MVEVIYMELCYGCKDIYIPEDLSHCDTCIEHAKSIQEEESGGSE